MHYLEYIVCVLSIVLRVLCRNMFRRKLKALGYHTIDKINLENPAELKTLVVWLEDQKIRHYKIDERKDLRSKSGNGWMDCYKKYLTALECPFSVTSSSLSCIEWLLELAIKCEFDDKAEENPSLKCGLIGTAGPMAAAKLTANDGPSALDIDVKNQDFRGGLAALAKLLGITTHPDPIVVLEATRLLIEERLSSDALKKAKDTPDKKSDKGEMKTMKVTAKECGFDSGDPALDEAAKVLRLLHLSELRDLQTKINELIVSLQQITADPKTDQRLGKVGK